jgi:predicted metalloprotease
VLPGEARAYARPMLVSRARRLGVLAALLAALALLSSPAGASAAPAMGPFLDDVFGSVNTYWQQTDAAEGRPAPSAHHVWVAPGAQVVSGCGATATDTSAFYCPTDDTIYVGQKFAASLYDGVDGNLPGQAAGFGRAVGAYAVAYVVAHEYGHNVQAERGIRPSPFSAMPTELNADCLAGTWTEWEYGHGKITQADVQQVVDAALAAGDFDFASPDHHGTPQQRRDAVMTGIRSGSPPSCDKYLT